MSLEPDMEVIKRLEIGAFKAKVKWHKDLRIDQLVCLLNNTEDMFYVFDTRNSRVIKIPYEDTDYPEIKIWGIDVDTHRIMASEWAKYDDGPTTFNVRLTKHEESKMFPREFDNNDNLIKKWCEYEEIQEISTDNNPRILFKKTAENDDDGGDGNVKEEEDVDYCYMQHIITISWNQQGDYEYKEFIKITEFKDEENSISLPSREKAYCVIYKLRRHKNRYFPIRSFELSPFITHNTCDDVRALKEKAVGFLYSEKKRTMPVNYLYRDKPQHHPTILETKRTGVMVKYRKDNNGDQASSINNQIDGLFFNATGERYDKKHDPRPISYFGDFRILIPPQHLLPYCNMYFADFYCMNEGKPHYVTLVLTIPHSKEDNYCKQRLVYLDLTQNDFLWFERSMGIYKTCLRRKLYVEVLFTEDIPVAEMLATGELKIYFVKMWGQSTNGGIPKRMDCKTCNLDKIPGIV